MTTAYTPSLRLALPQQGTLDGMWGTVVNNGITALADAAIAGTATIAMSNADRTLTAANEAADEARSMALRITGTLTAQRAVICPAVSKLYLVENATTGGHGVNVRTPSGAGTVVAPGARVFLYCNGVDVIPATSADLTAIQNSAPQWLTGVTGTAALTANANPPITAYVIGQTFRFVWPHPTPSTGPLTININGLGARNIMWQGATLLMPGAIIPWSVVEIVFDGGVFQLQHAASATHLTGSTPAVIPVGALGSGTADATTVLRGDRTFAPIAGLAVANATNANRLTQHNIINQNLNTITQAGHYDGAALANAPLGSGEWWYIEVIRHSNFAPGTSEWVMQRATGLGGATVGRVFVRNGIAPAGWTAWQEVGSLGNQLAHHGWQRFAGGLILQWTHGIAGGGGANFINTLPIAFPAACYIAFGVHKGAASADITVDHLTMTAASVGMRTVHPANVGCLIFAIGS